MDKEKRNVCFVLTILGVILIVVIQTIISLDDEAEEKEINFIKVNVISSFKKCLYDKICEENDVKFSYLVEKEYLKGYFLEEIKNYSYDSYITYPNFEVYLIEK